MVKIKNLKQHIGTIDIRSFMKIYYGISHRDINQMTHETASLFFPNLCRTSFSYIEKNPELLGCGKIVLVRDSNENIAPYVVPEVELFVEETQFGIEMLIENIIASLKITSDLSESAVILIEGQDSLDDLVHKDKSTKSAQDLPSTLIEINDDDRFDGVIVTFEGSVKKLSLKQDSLEELSKKTDTVAVVLEDDQSITLIVDGVSQHDFDFIMLRTNLYAYLDSYEPEEIKREYKLLPAPSYHDFYKMSDYELTVLMKKYKFNHQFDYYHLVRRELVKRTKKSKETKRSIVKQKRKKYREEE